ncbi:MAG: rubredoxin [Rhodobacteraceae bacterium]|nr:rubredoxin [Paracoccaceae bacterium]
MTTFEGSYLGTSAKISAAAVMECKVCWTPYDPAEGDDTRQIDPGTPFLALPDDWSCPNCSAPKEQFLVHDDPGSDAAAEAALLSGLTAKLVTEFTEVWHAKMRDVPIVNNLLQVQAAGWGVHGGRPLGVLISPWFMNLVQLPSPGEDWSDLRAGQKEIMAFPSGDYEFIHNTRPVIGGYKACSLFSPMNDFKTQAQAIEVAEAVMVALFDEANRAETDRSDEIRAAREAELAAQAEAEAAEAAEAEADAGAAPADTVPSRRQLITGGLSDAQPDPADAPRDEA